MTNLNTLIPPHSHFVPAEALGINDRGQVIGCGSLPNGQRRGFLLTPLRRSSPKAGRAATEVNLPTTRTMPATPAARWWPARQQASLDAAPLARGFRSWPQ